MFRPISLTAGLGLLALAACQSCNKPQGLTAADRTAIDKVRTDYVAAWNAGNVDAIVALYVPLPFVQVPDRPILRGGNAVRAYLKTVLGTPTRPTIDIAQSLLDGRQDLAVMSGTFTLTPAASAAHAKGAASAPPAPSTGKFLAALRKWHGTWKISQYGFSYDAQLAAEKSEVAAGR